MSAEGAPNHPGWHDGGFPGRGPGERGGLPAGEQRCAMAQLQGANSTWSRTYRAREHVLGSWAYCEALGYRRKVPPAKKRLTV